MSPESEFESYVEPPSKRVTIMRMTKELRALKPGDPPVDVSWHTLMSIREYARRHRWTIVQLKNKKLEKAWTVWRLR